MTENKTAEPQESWKTEDAVAYQKGTIVSRTLLKKGKGTVTLFAFDAGQALSEHTTPFDALLHVVDGAAEVEIDHIAHTVQAGEMILLPANHPHAVRAAVSFKMILTMIRE